MRPRTVPIQGRKEIYNWSNASKVLSSTLPFAPTPGLDAIGYRKKGEGLTRWLWSRSVQDREDYRTSRTALVDLLEIAGKGAKIVLRWGDGVTEVTAYKLTSRRRI